MNLLKAIVLLLRDIIVAPFRHWPLSLFVIIASIPPLLSWYFFGDARIAVIAEISLFLLFLFATLRYGKWEKEPVPFGRSYMTGWDFDQHKRKDS